MRYTSVQIAFQEVPDQISLSFMISGCRLGCKGCHSADSWNQNAGESLSVLKFARMVRKYRSGITCVLFLGGEWHEQELLLYLRYARRQGLQTCLYTGLDDVSSALKKNLTYLKTGRWIAELGGLNSPTTNQQMIEVATRRNLNHLFTTRGVQHGTTDTGTTGKESRFHQSLFKESERS